MFRSVVVLVSLSVSLLGFADRALAQDAKGKSNGVEGRVSDLEVDVASITRAQAALDARVKGLEGRVGSLEAAREAERVAIVEILDLPSDTTSEAAFQELLSWVDGGSIYGVDPEDEDFFRELPDTVGTMQSQLGGLEADVGFLLDESDDRYRKDFAVGGLYVRAKDDTTAQLITLYPSFLATDGECQAIKDGKGRGPAFLTVPRTTTYTISMGARAVVDACGQPYLDTKGTRLSAMIGGDESQAPAPGEILLPREALIRMASGLAAPPAVPAYWNAIDMTPQE